MQIAGRRALRYPEQPELPKQQLSHEPIDKVIDLMPHSELRTQLTSAGRQSQPKRMPREQRGAREGNIANLGPLSQGPAEADNRELPEH